MRECNYGALNGAPVARIDAERSRRIDQPFPEGESYRQVVERVSAFLAELAPAFGGARVLVIGHRATHWALDHLLDGIPLEELVDAPFTWQDGWSYEVPARRRRGSTGGTSSSRSARA